MQPQSNPEDREQIFPYPKEASITCPSPQHMPHWHGCINSGTVGSPGQFIRFLVVLAKDPNSKNTILESETM